MNIPLNIDWQQILLHLLNFVILFAILYFLLYKPVKSFMDKRTEHYKKLNQEAEAKLAEAEKDKAEYDRRLLELKDELERERAANTAELKKQRDERLAKAREEASAIMEDARMNAEFERKRIIDSANDEISQIASLAAAKLVFKDTPEAYEQFLEAVEGSEKHE